MSQVRTAKEVVTDAGFDPEQIGKVRVRVGGIPVSKPDHLVKIGDDVTKVEVVVGNEMKEVEYPAGPEFDISEDAQAVEKAQGEKATEKSEALAKSRKAEKEKQAEEKAEAKKPEAE